MALDFLLIQASSVPCEHAFSSAAETNTKKHNHRSPTLEALQLLKAWYKGKRGFDFLWSWATSEREMTAATSDIDHLAMLFADPDCHVAIDAVIARLVEEEGIEDVNEQD